MLICFHRIYFLTNSEQMPRINQMSLLRSQDWVYKCHNLCLLCLISVTWYIQYLDSNDGNKCTCRVPSFISFISRLGRKSCRDAITWILSQHKGETDGPLTRGPDIRHKIEEILLPFYIPSACVVIRFWTRTLAITSSNIQICEKKRKKKGKPFQNINPVE